MATIKEKANECIPYPCPMWYAGDGEGYEKSKKDVDTKRHIFELGANAVLKEIENILDITKPYLGNPFATLEERTRGVYDLIKELKGE